MTAPAPAPGTEAREAARWLNSYARRFSAGAFATPTAKDMELIIDTGRWRHRGGVAIVERVLDRDSVRTDWTGRAYDLLSGWRIAQYLAAEPGATLPDLQSYDRIYSWIEDPNVTRQLKAQGRRLTAIRISAASEIIGCWGRETDGWTYAGYDRATLVQLPERADMRPLRAEAAALDGWLDDFPYYSDGSWSALSLRGFNPADPTWGIKPAEMSRAWWKENPQAAAFDKCKWTVLAERCPHTVDLVRRLTAAPGLGWGGGLERVRFLRMTSSGKRGHLARHTDITDKAAGTRNGLITRFHLPIITQPRITMSAWNLRGEKTTVHLPEDSIWYLDARKPHAVDNTSGTTRIHLVVDVLTGPATREAIAAGADAAA